MKGNQIFVAAGPHWVLTSRRGLFNCGCTGPHCWLVACHIWSPIHSLCKFLSALSVAGLRLGGDSKFIFKLSPKVSSDRPWMCGSGPETRAPFVAQTSCTVWEPLSLVDRQFVSCRKIDGSGAANRRLFPAGRAVGRFVLPQHCLIMRNVPAAVWWDSRQNELVASKILNCLCCLSRASDFWKCILSFV
jgi:hypothetical protein